MQLPRSFPRTDRYPNASAPARELLSTDHVKAICAILAALIPATQLVAQAELLDQRHDDPDVYETHRNIKDHAPVAQEFTPTLGALDFIEIWTRDIGTHGNQSGASLRILLREGGLEGEVIGISGAVALPDGHNDITRFKFR